MVNNIDEIKDLIERYLDNKVSHDELIRLREWVREDPDLGMWLWEQMSNSNPVIVDEVKNRIRDRIGKKQKLLPEYTLSTLTSQESKQKRKSTLRLHLIYGSVAAILLLIAGVGIKQVAYTHDSNPFKVYTDEGQRSRVTLTDGTEVLLNVKSEISYRYDNRNNVRAVELKGEALFDVASDPRHTLIVNCGEMTIECVGTKFNIKAYPDEDRITVVLKEGSIIAHTENETVNMKPDMLVRYDKNIHQMVSNHVNSTDYCEWMNGHSRFNEEPIEDILKVLSRYHKVKMEILSPELSKSYFSGSIGDGNLTDALDILTEASEATYYFENDTTVYITKK